MAIDDILNDSWGPHTHTEVEEALKAKLGQMDSDTQQAQQTADGKYTMPSTGVPKDKLAQDVRTTLDKVADKYEKPNSGIPKNDLSSEVQGYLESTNNKANHQSVGQSTWMLSIAEWPRVEVFDITGAMNAGGYTGLVYNAQEKKLYLRTTTNGTTFYSEQVGEPVSYVVYIDKQTKNLYVWNSDDKSFVLASGNANGSSVTLTDEYVNVHVDGYEPGSTTNADNNVVANVNTVAAKVDELIAELSSIAFQGAKPNPIGDLVWTNVDQPTPYLVHISPILLSNVGDNGDQVDVIIRGYNLTTDLAVRLVDEIDGETLSQYSGIRIVGDVTTLSAAEINSAAGAKITIEYTGTQNRQFWLMLYSHEINESVKVYGNYYAVTPQQYSVTMNGSHFSSTNNDPSANSGGPYETDIEPDEGYNITGITVTVNGVAVTATSNGEGGYHIEIEDVDGPIVITVTTAEVEVPTYTINTDGLSHLSLSEDEDTDELTVDEGTAWHGKLVAANGYVLPDNIHIYFDSNHLAEMSSVLYTYSKSTGQITVRSVGGNLWIVAEGIVENTVNVEQQLLNVDSDFTGSSYVASSALEIELTPVVTDNSDPENPVTATMNGDVRVLIGGVEKFNQATESGTNAAGITFSSDTLTIPAAAMTGDVVIIATAWKGTVEVKANAAATRALWIDGTPYDIINGTKTLTPASGNANSLAMHTAITEIDFRGMLYSGNPAQLFRDMPNLTKIKGLVIKAPAGASMEYFAQNCNELAEVQTIGWEMGNVTSYEGAFQNAGQDAANGLTMDTSRFVSANCSTLIYMFMNSGIKSVNVNDWVVGGIDDMSYMFFGCRKLNKVDARDWTTSAVLANIDAFAIGSGLNELHLGAFVTSGVAAIGSDSLFPLGKSNTPVVNLYMHASTPPAVGADWIGVDPLASIHIPRVALGSTSPYATADVWKKYYENMTPDL